MNSDKVLIPYLAKLILNQSYPSMAKAKVARRSRQKHVRRSIRVSAKDKLGSQYESLPGNGGVVLRRSQRTKKSQVVKTTVPALTHKELIQIAGILSNYI